MKQIVCGDQRGSDLNVNLRQKLHFRESSISVVGLLRLGQNLPGKV